MGSRDSRDFPNLIGERFRGSLELRKHVGESVSPIVGISRGDKRVIRAAHRDIGRDAAGNHERDRYYLPAQMEEISYEFLIERSHASPIQIRRARLRLVPADLQYLTASDSDNAIGHRGDGRIVSDHRGCGSQFTIDAFQRFEDDLAR